MWKDILDQVVKAEEGKAGDNQVVRSSGSGSNNDADLALSCLQELPEAFKAVKEKGIWRTLQPQ